MTVALLSLFHAWRLPQQGGFHVIPFSLATSKLAHTLQLILKRGPYDNLLLAVKHRATCLWVIHPSADSV